MATIAAFIIAAIKLMALVAVGIVLYLFSRIYQIRERERAGKGAQPADVGSGIPQAQPAPTVAEGGGVHAEAWLVQSTAIQPDPMPLDDLAARLLSTYPSQVDVALKFLGWVGILGAGLVSVATVLLGMLPTILSFWATHAPDLTSDEDEEELIDTRTWGPATDPNRAVSVPKSGW